MTTKSRTQAGAKGKDTRAQLKTQAAGLIEDVRMYTADTRRAVYVALENLKLAESGAAYTDVAQSEAELRRVLRAAKNGERLFDVNALGAEYVEQAEQIYELIEHSTLPDFITGGLMAALNANARHHDVEIWLNVDGSEYVDLSGYSVAAIAGLLRRVVGYGVGLEAKRDLAGLISAVLKHPDTPRELYGGMRDQLARLTEPDAVNEHPDVLRVALAVAKVEQEEEGGAS